MTKQTMIEDWVKYPVIFFTDLEQSKPEFRKPLKTKVGGKFKSFYLTPERVNTSSMVNTLKDKLGFEEKGVKTLMTEIISTKEVTQYNGSKLYLTLNDDKVYLNVITDDKIYNEVYWKIDTLVSSMKVKNLGRGINKELVKKLLNEGKMRVKFNVSKSKDHGTKWSFDTTVKELVKPIEVKPQVKEDFDGDFFSDF